MTREEIVCRQSKGMGDLSTATEARDLLNSFSPFKFTIFACRCCTKYHLTAKTDKAKA